MSITYKELKEIIEGKGVKDDTILEFIYIDIIESDTKNNLWSVYADTVLRIS